MALRRLTALALAGVLALGASGCGDDSPTPTPGTSSAAASPTPSGPVAPVLPDLASRNDAVGAKAFVKYWFATLTYAMHTGHTDLVAASSAKECATCSGIASGIADIYGSGGQIEGGNWVPISFVSDPSAPKPLLRWLVQVRQARHEVVGAEAGNGPVAKRVFSMRVSVVWRSNRWLLQEAVDGRQ